MQPTWGPEDILGADALAPAGLGLPEEPRPEGAGASWKAGQQRG